MGVKLRIILTFLIVATILVSGCLGSSDTTETDTATVVKINKEQFNSLALNALYVNGFCYEGMEQEEGKQCGDIEYPFIRIYNAEDYTEQGKILLVTQVTDDLYEEMPELYNEEIVYVFRNANQETVDRFYVKENKWDK